MKTKLFCSCLLLFITVSVFAIDYPVYRPSNRSGSVGAYSGSRSTTFQSTSSLSNQNSSMLGRHSYGVPSTSPVGATGPRRVVNAGFTVDTDDCEEYCDFNSDGVCDYCGVAEASHGTSSGGSAGGNAGTPGSTVDKKDQIDIEPVGDFPLVLLMLLCLSYAAFLSFRRCRKGAL